MIDRYIIEQAYDPSTGCNYWSVELYCEGDLKFSQDCKSFDAALTFIKAQIDTDYNAKV